MEVLQPGRTAVLVVLKSKQFLNKCLLCFGFCTRLFFAVLKRIAVFQGAYSEYNFLNDFKYDFIATLPGGSAWDDPVRKCNQSRFFNIVSGYTVV